MDYSFIREKVNSENSTNYVLSILLSEDGFSFYISGKESVHTPVQFFSKQFEKPGIENLTRELEGFTELDNLIFHKSVIIFHTGAFSLIPVEFYSSKHQDGYMHLLHLKKDDAITNVSFMPAMNINIVFHIPEKLRTIIESKFPHSSIIHSACPPLYFGHQKPEQSCLVYHFGSSISVTVFTNRELKLFNIFNVQNENDLVYYLNLALRSCNMINQETTFYFMGEKDKDSPDYKMISKYISRPAGYPEFQDAENDFDFPPALLFNHLEGLACVS